MKNPDIKFLLTSALQARPDATLEEILKLVPLARQLPRQQLSDKVEAIRRKVKT